MKYNFIIPYRNRKEHLDEFIRRFTGYIQTANIDAEFYVVHQIHPGDFNRGALKNIGFLEFCKTRPDGLFIFHDVDTYPTYWGSIDYMTKPGEIRHPIGLKNQNLGGICCTYKNEYEKVNGFPNYWGWGIEDCTIYHRVKKLNISINEDNIVDLSNRSRLYMPNHQRSTKQNIHEQTNTELHTTEVLTGDNSNGISSIDYTILSKMELAPHFTLLNVNFTLKT